MRRWIPIALLALGCSEPLTGLRAECAELGLDDTECETIAAWRLQDALPPARGNAYADDPRAAELGRAIFFDTGFSTVPDVSCATCHRADRAFQDGVAVSEVIAGSPGARNSPTLYNAAWNDGFFFWDGRADSLWSQPLFAFENEIEMRTTRLAIAHRIASEYGDEYEAIFGALPALDGLPAEGKPGDPSWEALREEDRDAVNRVVANVGKALEAYMRRIVSGPSALDRYLDGDRDALDDDARRGLARFVKSGCATCHSGPMLADGAFRLTAASGTDGDRGRAEGIEILLASPFSAAGPYFDQDAGEALTLPEGPSEDDEGRFRTPSLRNIAQTAPYGRSGTRDLESFITSSFFYEEGDERVIAAFLRALDGAPPPSEWTDP
ncbi:cytochrome-c peroxidase [Sandaracinus amylolyticus]|uniref:Methylamine utilization protein n=1 Tax=Sandaracinus amylolyticus TaxID=927083 RepID=A0A0F6YLT8_9BACT|nr:cytochrome-c peroxidase [Sandaracinus amylolyticus]AKF09888.1 methylamine utilization protein [Sandaracinus amylolyticus]